MAYFDMDTEYSNSIPLTLAALCREVAEEQAMDDENGNHIIGDEAYREYFRNGHGSGLIQKLCNNLNYDLEPFLNATGEPKHNALKLLKLLYSIEKTGAPKRKNKSLSQTRVRITDILAKPRLENIQTGLPHQSIYEELFDELLSDVRRSTTGADTRKRIIERAQACWSSIYYRLLSMVFADTAAQDKDESLKEMLRISKQMQEINEQTNEQLEQSNLLSDGVFESFYVLLECHRCKCVDATILHNLKQAIPPYPPSEKTIHTMDRLESVDYTWRTITRIERFADGINSDDVEVIGEIIRLWPIIFDGQQFTDHDHKDWLRFCLAVKHVRNVLPWLHFVKGDAVHYEEKRAMPVDLYVCIIQEIICVLREKTRLKNDCWGYNNAHQSLRSALKDPENADPLMVTLWVQRLENRVAVVHGRYELMCALLDLERVFFQIKQYAFSHYSINEFQEVNASLLRKIYDIVPRLDYVELFNSLFNNEE